MGQVNITITLASVGTDAGPFDITDNLGNTLATGVTASQLLAGYVVTGVDDSVTTITVCSTGTCDNCRSVDVELTPPLGECKLYRFKLTSRPDSGCSSYTIQADPDANPATFTARICGDSQDSTYSLAAGQSLLLCLSSPPVGAQISYTSKPNNCGYFETAITYLDCSGTQQTALVSTNTTEFDACILDGQYSVDTNYVTVTNYGPCNS